MVNTPIFEKQWQKNWKKSIRKLQKGRIN